jgi:hypothetical protein
MSSTDRQRLSVRTGAAPVPALVEGVPASLEPKLRDWIYETGALDPDEVQHLLIRLDLVLPTAYSEAYQRDLAEREKKQARLTAQWEARRQERGDSAYVPPKPFAPMPPDPHVSFLAYGTAAAILWDIVDDLLFSSCREPLPPDASPISAFFNLDVRRTKRIVEPLRRLLAEARSVYEITPNLRGLRRRAEAGLSAAITSAASAADRGGYPEARRHLERARDKLFALHADPSGAYVDLIRAVEAVASPMFLPRDQLPTLGKVRDHLRDAGTRYEYVLTDKAGTPGSTASVIEMLTSLWEGHSDRHAGGPREVPVSQQACEAALAVASTLVTLLSSGAVRPRV